MLYHAVRVLYGVSREIQNQERALKCGDRFALPAGNEPFVTRHRAGTSMTSPTDSGERCTQCS